MSKGEKVCSNELHIYSHTHAPTYIFTWLICRMNILPNNQTFPKIHGSYES
jgi:hypothetical protein